MKKAYIIHSGQKLQFDIPSNWNVLTFARFPDSFESKDVSGMTQRALNNPVGSLKISESLAPSDTIAIIVEDITRPTPKRTVMETLLMELARVGVSDKNISIIVALGTHRFMTAQEMEKTFGRKLLRQYSFYNHDCRAPDLVPAGRLKAGCEVKINRKVYEASFRIGIGSIVPHPLNGFGGGGKILFPGVADFASIREHHLKYSFHHATGLGKLAGNKFNAEIVSISRLAQLNCIINCVIDQKDGVFDIIAGDPVEAHLEGIEISRRTISQKFEQPSDITITSAFPYQEGTQIIKPVAPAAMVTKEGGCIILVAVCKESLPDAFIDCFEQFHDRYDKDLKGGVFHHFNNNRLIMEEGAVDFNMALAYTLVAQHRFKIILVSPDIPRGKGEKMGFIYAEDIDNAIELASSMYKDPTVNIIASGGIMLPVFG